MPTKSTVLIFIMVIFTLTNSTAQSVVVSGSVTDTTDFPLIGVTILLKGNSATGGVTDADGKFLLQSPQPSGTLIFSYVGFGDQQADFNSGNLKLTVKMFPQRKLDEVVIVGYGVQKKSDVTGAISSIKGKDIANQPIANLAGSLEGKLSGIHVVTPSGTPGAGLLVSVRGSENPLYVVDGIPMISESNSSLSTSYDTQGNITGNGQNVSSISDINPDDIANIEVLKDASSASIYGARAANGVVLITTKRGAAGKTSFNLNYYSGIQQVSKNIQFLSADGFRSLVLDAQHQDLLKYQQDPSYFGDGFDPGILTTPLPSGWFTNVNTDWLGQIFQVAPVNNAELSASGGTDKSRFYISSSYFDQEGIVINSYYKRFSNRINLDQTVNNKLSFGENLSLSYSRNRRSFNDDTYTGIVTNALGCSPFEPVYNPDGTYSDYTLYQSLWLSDNPVKSAKEVIAFTSNYRALGTIYANYKILPELAFKTSWSIDYTYLTDDQYWSPITSDAVTVGGKADNNSFNQIVWLGENTLTYDKTFDNKHHLDIVGGFTLQQDRSNNLGVSGQGFPLGSGLQNVSSSAIITGRDASGTNWALVSFLGRVNYDYKGKYLASASFRADGSSRFSFSNRYGYFPAGSLGWRISDESFWPKNNVVTNLKFRGSYGLTGDQEIGDFEYINFWQPVTYNGVAGLDPRNLADPPLHWQSNAVLDIGADYEMWNGLVNGSIEYYHEIKYDLLSKDVISGTTGFSTITRNSGKVLNEGWEFNIDVTPVRGKLTWQFGFNISYLHNKIVTLTTDSTLLFTYNDLPYTHILIVGQPLGTFWGVKYLGVNSQTGDPMYQDLNGDGVIDDNDAQVIGHALPDYYGGFNSDLSWANWELNVATSFSIGNKVYNLIRGENTNYGYADGGWGADDSLYAVYSNNPTYVTNRWMKAGDNSGQPRASIINDNNYQTSSQNIENGSFLRINDIMLSYLIKPKNARTISSARIFFEVQNAYTFTSYSGFDPEVSSTGGTNIETTGVDYAAYPKARTYMIGINLGF